MKRKTMAFLTILLTLLLVSALSQIFLGVVSGEEDIGFRVVDQGDLSGLSEETFFVVENENEWENIWEKHAILSVPPKPCPEIMFSEEVVICALMGRCSTAGYSISVEKVWEEEEGIHVRIVKHNPPGDMIVAQILTYPFVFASVERTDRPIIFHIKDDSSDDEIIMPEFPTVGAILLLLAALSAILLLLKNKRILFTS